MLQTFLLIAATIFISDLGDKTQLTIILLTNKTRKHFHLLLGVIIGFLLGNGIAIIVGALFGQLLPARVVQFIAGIIFILFGLWSLRSVKEEAGNTKIKEKSPFWSGLTLIFLSEFGDKSQIATALFATKYNPISVLFSAMVGLIAISIITIYLSKLFLKNINPHLLAKISGVLFIVIGVFFLVV